MPDMVRLFGVLARPGNPDAAEVYDARGNGDGETASTLSGDHESRVTDYTSIVMDGRAPFCFPSNRGHDGVEEGISPTLRVGSGLGIPSPPAVAFKASHYTRGKDGRPAPIVPPLSADADRGDQDPLVLNVEQELAEHGDPERGARQNGAPTLTESEWRGKTVVLWGHFDPFNTVADAGPSASVRTNTGSPTVGPLVYRKVTRAHDKDGDGERWDDADRANTVDASGHSPRTAHAVVYRPPATSFNWQSGGDVRLNPTEERTGALHKSQTPAIFGGPVVRRLTPLECERLQGFPDGWTAWGVPADRLEEYRELVSDPAATREDFEEVLEEISDTQRYRQMGNAVTVPVAWWIGVRVLRAHLSLEVAP